MSERRECSGFETLGADIKKERIAMKLSRRALAEKINIVPRVI